MTAAATNAPAFKSHRNPKGIAPSEAALANENQRTNVPYNAGAWDDVKGLDDDDRNLMRWFHLHALDQNFSNRKIGDLLGGYDRTNASRILRGTYGAADWSGILAALRAYQGRVSLFTRVPGIDKEPDFVETEASKRFWQGLDTASRGGFVILAGPSGAGKTKTVAEWDARNPGRMVRINAPATGGHVALVRRLAKRLGMSHRKHSISDILLSLDGCLDSRHVLCIDQGSRLIPSAKQVRAAALEVLMDINEETGCGIVIPLTWRAVEAMSDLEYQIEQVTGRAEIFRAPQITRDQVAGIARQYGDFSVATVAALHGLALRPGGLRTVAKVLSLADRMARFDKSDIVADAHVASAIAKRFENMGGENPFDK